METNVIYPKQFGFRKGHSTTDAFALVVGEMLSAFSENFHFLSVFVDLKKAFDTVEHSIILKKLEWIGVRGNALTWFESYLSERQQEVVFENEISDKRNVTTGVPQGSLLGVALFQLHIDDLRKCLKHTGAILYADDTTIYAFGRNIRALKSKLQRDLNNVSMWLKSNKLLLNVSKTKIVLFLRHLDVKVNLTVDSQLIEQVKCVKFLGYYIDSKLSFDHHSHYLYESLLKSIFVIRKLSTFVPKRCLLTLYYAHYYSRLSYGINIWMPLLKENTRSNFVLLQKRIIRIIN